MKITETELEAAHHYLQQHLKTHSMVAKKVACGSQTLMKENPISL